MRTTLVMLIASLLMTVRGPAQSSIPWSAVDMGFVVSSSSTSIVKSVVGQGFVGTLTGTNSIIESGFLVDTLFRSVISSVTEHGGVPKEYLLHQNYPNPFNPTTTIRYDVGGIVAPSEAGGPVASGQQSAISHVKLVVYDLLGREVAALVNEPKDAGTYEVKFDASGLSSGVYIYRIRAGDYVAAKRLLLLK